MKLALSNFYIGLVTAAGTASVAYSLAHWHTQDLARYLFYCAIALVASRMKVALPGVNGTLSMNFLFVLVGISDLSLGETMVMGCLGMLVQSLFNTRQRPRPVQVLFSVASMACSILAANAAYHALPGAFRAVEQSLMLLAAAGVFFLVNTFSVSLVIALTESKRATAVWRDAYLWSFPNYLVGATVAWMISAASRYVGWQSSLLLLPILYVIYRSHSVYVRHLEEAKAYAEEQRKHAEE